MKVQILVDNKKSWIVPYALKLLNEIKINFGSDARLVHSPDEINQGDVLFLLGCENIFKNLDLNTHNIVIHESALPAGKGWSPLTWQILEGKNSIPITLFEAAQKIDSGVIYLEDTIEFTGNELNDELKHLQGEKTIEMAMEFLKNYPNLGSKAQVGNESFYDKRSPEHSELNINKSIKEQFNLLRVVDNERYPAFFYHKGEKYVLKISKTE